MDRSWVLLSSPDEMHDFDAVAFAQGADVVVLPHENFVVQFNGDPSLVEPELADQVCDRQACGERVCLAIDDHVHAENILISAHLYNLGTIW